MVVGMIPIQEIDQRGANPLRAKKIKGTFLRTTIFQLFLVLDIMSVTSEGSVAFPGEMGYGPFVSPLDTPSLWIDSLFFRLSSVTSSELLSGQCKLASLPTRLVSIGLQQRVYQIVTPRERSSPQMRNKTMRNVFKGFQVGGMGKPKAPKMHSLREVSSLNKGFSAMHAPHNVRPIHQSVKMETAKSASRPGRNVGVRGGHKVG